MIAVCTVYYVYLMITRLLVGVIFVLIIKGYFECCINVVSYICMILL